MKESTENTNPTPLMIFCAVFIYLISRLLWCGDSAFVWDEAKVINLAMRAGPEGIFYPLGLQGTRGYRYGPFPIWFYQGLLIISKNIFTITYLKIVLVSGMMMMSFFWLVRTLQIKWFFAYLLLLLSPYLWFYERNLWDNSLNIPLSFFVFACYCSFARKQALWKLALIGLGLVCMLLTHLMSLPFVAGVSLLLVLENKSWLKNNWTRLLLILGHLLFLCLPYIKHLATAPKSPDAKATVYSVTSLFFPFFSARFFGFYDFAYFLGKGWHKFQEVAQVFNSLYSGLILLTAISFGFYWTGIYVAGKKVFVSAAVGRSKALTLAIFVLFLNMGLCLLVGLRSHPHYHNSFIVVCFILTWYGLNHLSDFKKFKFVIASWLLATMVLMIDVPARLHYFSGTKSLHYGPTLKNQVAMACEANQFGANTQINMQELHINEYAETFAVLRSLEPASICAPNTQVSSSMVLKFQDKSSYPWNGKLIFEQK